MRLPMAPAETRAPSARTCAGHCCHAVYLPFNSKSELRRAAMAARQNKVHGKPWEGWQRDDGSVDMRLVLDIERMAVLFYQLPVGTPHFDAGGLPSTAEVRAWGCVAWDRSTGLCREYELRPDVCSAYPYGNPCGATAGCDYRQEGRAK